MSAGMHMSCPLCLTSASASAPSGEEVLIWRGPQLRLIRVREPGFAAFYRIVWNAHIAEFSDLTDTQRQHCMQAVVWVEEALRQHLAPTKINLASLGNMVAHLHWHIIARFDWDSHFPAPIWAPPQRPRALAQESALAQQLPALDAALRQRFEQG